MFPNHYKLRLYKNTPLFFPGLRYIAFKTATGVPRRENGIFIKIHLSGNQTLSNDAVAVKNSDDAFLTGINNGDDNKRSRLFTV